LILKKAKYRLIFVLLLLVGGNTDICAQPGAPGGPGGPGCWPPSTCDTPINSELVLLLIAGLLLAFYYLKKTNSQSKIAN